LSIKGGMSNHTGIEEGTAGKGGCRDLRPWALKCLRSRELVLTHNQTQADLKKPAVPVLLSSLKNRKQT
jgi:hypothetical protein